MAEEPHGLLDDDQALDCILYQGWGQPFELFAFSGWLPAMSVAWGDSGGVQDVSTWVRI